LDSIDYSIEKSYFSYLPKKLDGGRIEANSKAFISPSKPFMASYHDGHFFIIEFDMYDTSLSHPEQAMVEIYNYISADPEDAFTEMEYHGPYEEIKPGESILLSETWQLLPFQGDDEEKINFLDSLY
jgi:hypothetical protein